LTTKYKPLAGDELVVVTSPNDPQPKIRNPFVVQTDETLCRIETILEEIKSIMIERDNARKI